MCEVDGCIVTFEEYSVNTWVNMDLRGEIMKMISIGLSVPVPCTEVILCYCYGSAYKSSQVKTGTWTDLVNPDPKFTTENN